MGRLQPILPCGDKRSGLRKHSHFGRDRQSQWSLEDECAELQESQAPIHSVGKSGLVTGRWQQAELLVSNSRGVGSSGDLGLVLAHWGSSQVSSCSGDAIHVKHMTLVGADGGSVHDDG